MNRAQAHFVECQPRSVESSGDFSTPPVPPGTFRPEAYVTTDTDTIYWYDPDWNYLYLTSIPDSGNSATTIAQTADGSITLIGYGDVGGDSAIAKIDEDLNVDEDFFTPDDGWALGEVVFALRLNADESILYATSSANDIYKFNFSTGAQIWKNTIINCGTMALDDNENLYVYISGSWLIKKYDSDCTLLDTSGTVGSIRDMFYDSENNTIVCAGNVILTKNIWIVDADTLDVLYSYVDTGSCNSIIKYGDYYYVDKATGTDGYNLIKLDNQLNLIDGVAGPASPRGMCIDWNGNIAIADIDADSMNIYVYDTDLNLIDIYPSAGGGVVYGSPEMAKINYVTGGTPGTSGSNVFWVWDDSICGFEHLIGETLKIFIDGVVYPDQEVSSDGTIILPCDVTADSEIHIGLGYTSKLKPMKPMSQIDMMKKKATCKQMGLSFHNTDDSNGRADGVTDMGVKYGVHDDDMKEIDFNDPQWKNKCEIDGLFTGSVAVHVPDGFGVNMPLQISTNAPLPCTVRAMIPAVNVTGA